jgi:hypothetical protein
MADPEFDHDRSSISVVNRDEPSSVPVPLASFDPNTRTEQSCTQICDVRMILSGDVSLTKQGEDGNEANTRTEPLHGNDHEHNDMNSNTEVKCDEGETFVTSMLVEGKVDNEIDSDTVSQLKHIDTISSAEEKQCSEETPQGSISAVTEPPSYSLHEYKFENSSQITGAWKEFTKKADICMKGCKW